MLQNQCRRDCCFHHSNVVVQDQWRHKRLLWKVSTSDEPSCFDNGGSKSEWRLNRAQPPAGVRTLTNSWSRNEFQAQKVNTSVVPCRMLKQVLEECVRLMLFCTVSSQNLYSHIDADEATSACLMTCLVALPSFLWLAFSSTPLTIPKVSLSVNSSCNVTKITRRSVKL